MSNLRQAAQQALTDMKDLEHTISALTGGKLSRLDDAIGRLEQALAEPEQEPVAWMYPHQLKEVSEYGRGGLGVRAYSGPSSPNLVPVYTTPTPRKPLTDYINAAGINGADSPHMVVEKLQSAIERAHGIGEQHE